MKHDIRNALMTAVALSVISGAPLAIAHEKDHGARKGDPAARMFERMDQNDDGVIDLNEAEAAAEKFTGHMTGRMDENDDGVIDTADRDAKIQKMREAVETRWNEADTDGDGTITDEEMRQQAMKRFEAADANGDGEVSKEEARAAAKEWHEEHGGPHMKKHGPDGKKRDEMGQRG